MPYMQGAPQPSPPKIREKCPSREDTQPRVFHWTLQSRSRVSTNHADCEAQSAMSPNTPDFPLRGYASEIGVRYAGKGFLCLRRKTDRRVRAEGSR